MTGKRAKPGDIVLKLLRVEALQGPGRSTAEAVRQIGVTVQTFYRWRNKNSGIGRDRPERLKHLETRILTAST